MAYRGAISSLQLFVRLLNSGALHSRRWMVILYQGISTSSVSRFAHLHPSAAVVLMLIPGSVSTRLQCRADSHDRRSLHRSSSLFIHVLRLTRSDRFEGSSFEPTERSPQIQPNESQQSSTKSAKNAKISSFPIHPHRPSPRRIPHPVVVQLLRHNIRINRIINRLMRTRLGWKISGFGPRRMV